jgi:acetyl-CoA acetyltransferase
VNDVAIVGVGRHAFGRFGPKTAIQMGAESVREACADAGIEWGDVQFAFGGSSETLFPDSVVGLLGMTGIPFMDVYNGCATAGTALKMTADAIRLGQYDIGVAVGFDKHLPGAFTGDPEVCMAPSWYGEVGQFLTTKFFAIKINRYMHDYGISPMTLARVAAKGYRNGALHPLAFRRKPLTEEQILSSRVLNYPLTQYMFCAPDEGAAAAVLCRADIAHRYSSNPVYLRASELRTRKYGAYEVHSSWAAVDEQPAPTVFASRAAYEVAGIGPEDVDVIQLQDTDAGAEVIHMAENGFCVDGDQEKLIEEGATEIGGTLPINTDGGLIANGEPIGASGLRQVYELVRQLRGQAGPTQVPGTPRVGYAQVYGAPGVASVSILAT